MEAAVAVAGPGTEPAILHLVDCSLLSPPRPGLDGRSRYLMLETVRIFGSGLLQESTERAGIDAALAGYALSVAEQAAARAAYQVSLDIFARLAAADPANTGWQRDLEGIRQKISGLDG